MKAFLIAAALLGSVAIMASSPGKPVAQAPAGKLIEHISPAGDLDRDRDREAFVTKLTALGFTAQAHPEPMPQSKRHHWHRGGRHHHKRHHRH